MYMFQNFIEVQRQMKNKHMTEEKREKTKKKNPHEKQIPMTVQHYFLLKFHRMKNMLS